MSDDVTTWLSSQPRRVRFAGQSIVGGAAFFPTLSCVAQYQFLSNQKTQIRPDGTILHDLRMPLGYWEAMDEDDEIGRGRGPTWGASVWSEPAHVSGRP